MPFEADFLAKWLSSGALLRTSGDQILLGAGPATRGQKGHFYAPDFFLRDRAPWVRFEHTAWVTRTELLALLPEAPAEKLSWAPADRPRFEKNFADLQDRFQTGELQKGVPFIFERAEARMTPERRASLIRSVLQYAQNPSVIPYGFWDQGEGILGCTPETLFRQDAQGVHTMALAGTHFDSSRLLEDPKERREHQLVIDSIVSELSLLGRVLTHPTSVVTLPKLSHLKTLIDLAPSSPVSFEKLVQALHPTPALGAFPRAAGWKWLEQVEASAESPRARFGAPLGAVWKNPAGVEESLCVVAIRNLQWKGSCLLLGAGCGIIAESQLDREWHELQGKLGAVKGILGL